MKFTSTMAGVLLGTLAATPLVTANAQAAAGSGGKGTNQRHATEFGPTLPPVGFVNYCQKTPNDCVADFGLFSATALKLDDKRWDKLARINSGVNHTIEPVSDEDLYGKAEVWALPANNRGDCEDYVLLKKRQLQDAGFPASSLRITVVLDEAGNGHAVLTVTAVDGDYVLDNRTDDIRRWVDTKYTFIKRQSDFNPRQWVALRNNVTNAFGGLSASKDDEKE